QYGGSVTTDIPYNALPQVIKSDLIALPNLGPDDVEVTQAAVGAPWTITFVGDMAGKPALSLPAISARLAGGKGAASVLTPGTQVFDTLRNIQQAVFTGGPSATVMDASGWNGDVTMNAGSGNDTLIAGSGNDVLVGGGGNDVITAGTGTDTLIGGGGESTLGA